MGTMDAAVGARLRSRRLALRRGLDEVALALDVTPHALQRIEDGHARASAEQLLLFCRALDMTPADIYRAVPENGHGEADAQPLAEDAAPPAR